MMMFGSKTDMSHLVDRLSEVPLFQRCDAAQLSKLARYMKETTFGPREFVMKQNDNGTRFYVIVDGLCDVIIDKKVVGKLTDGDYCGELALIENSNRTASIRAIKTTRAYSIDKNTFRRVVQKDMDIAFYPRNAVIPHSEDHLQKPSETTAHKEQKVHPSQAETRWLLQAIQSNVLFRHLTAGERRYLVQQMWKESVTKGDELIKEGENGDRFYVIRSGRFKVSQSSKGLLRYVTTKDCIGELALFHNAPRSATVSCLSSAAVVWCIDRNTLRFHVKELTETKQMQLVRFLKGVPLLSSLLSHEYARIASTLVEECYEEGQTVISEGETGDRFYLIKSGTVAVYKTEESLAEGTPLKSLNKGAYFGERALLTKEPRSATLIVEGGDAVLYSLTKDAFERLIGPLATLMSRHMDNSYHTTDAATAVADDETSSEEMERGNFKIATVTDDLDRLKMVSQIGIGGYGVVSMVRDPNTRKMYALKSVRKDLVIRNKQQTQIQAELAVMRALTQSNNGSPFVVNLHQTYQDEYRVYFLLDLASGGDLFHHMRIANAFSKRQVQFYAGCIIEALEYVHSYDVAYRDIKPENMIIASNGYLKLADFGLSKQLRSSHSKTYTVCGTPDYLAPECLLGRGHGRAVDWWALGIFIYELIAKVPPFMARPDRIADKILSAKPKFTYLFSSKAKALITALLKKNPMQRLTDANEIRNHPFFADFDWTALKNNTMAAPYVPRLKSDTDCSHFKVTLKADPSPPIAVADDKCIWAKDF